MKNTKTMKYYQVKVKYTKVLDNGLVKRVTEPYIFQGQYYTDIEARVYEELGSMIRGEFEIKEIKEAKLHDIFQYDECDVFYKCKITFNSATEDLGKEQKVTQSILLTAYSVKDAYERLKDSLSTMLVDFEVPTITRTDIVDVYPMNEVINE